MIQQRLRFEHLLARGPCDSGGFPHNTRIPQIRTLCSVVPVGLFAAAPVQKKYYYTTDHATQCKEPYQALHHEMEDIYDIITDNCNAHHYSKPLVYHGLIHLSPLTILIIWTSLGMHLWLPASEVRSVQPGGSEFLGVLTSCPS